MFRLSSNFCSGVDHVIYFYAFTFALSMALLVFAVLQYALVTVIQLLAVPLVHIGSSQAFWWRVVVSCLPDTSLHLNNNSFYKPTNTLIIMVWLYSFRPFLYTE